MGSGSVRLILKKFTLPSEGKWTGGEGAQLGTSAVAQGGEGKAGWGSGQRWLVTGMALRWSSMLGPAGLAGKGAVLAGTWLRPM